MRPQPTLRVALNSDYTRDADIDTRLQLCAEAGFTHIHWCEDLDSRELFDANCVARIRSLLARRGLALADLHGGIAEADIRSGDPKVRASGIALYANRLMFTRQLGGDALVIHPLDPGSPELPAALDALDRVVEYCRQYGVRLAVEAATEAEAEPYFRRFPANVVGYCCDVGHCNIQAPNTLYLLEKYADRLCVTHLHDNYGKEDDHRLPFDGVIDWQHIAGVLARIGYAKPLCLEVGRHSYISGQYSAEEKNAPLRGWVLEAYRRAARLVALVEGGSAGM